LTIWIIWTLAWEQFYGVRNSRNKEVLVLVIIMLLCLTNQSNFHVFRYETCLINRLLIIGDTDRIELVLLGGICGCLIISYKLYIVTRSYDYL